MSRLFLTFPLLVASLANAQQVPMGRVITSGTVSAALMPLNPPPALVEPLSVPAEYIVCGLMLSVSTADASVDSFQISTRVETASGARLDFNAIVKWNPARDWATQIFYTGKDPVAKVLSLSVIPLQPNQVKTFAVEQSPT